MTFVVRDPFYILYLRLTPDHKFEVQEHFVCSRQRVLSHTHAGLVR